MTDLDLVIKGGTVLPLTDPDDRAEAVWIAGGRIVAVGAEAALLRQAGDGTRVVDIGGCCVLPGFYDSHLHLVETGLVRHQLDLSGARSLAALLAIVRRHCGDVAPGEWVVCSGSWHEGRLREGRLPTRAELDEAAPLHPVLMPRGGHAAVVNSLALDRAGVADETPDPEGGRYVRDASGALTGLVLEDPALLPFVQALPETTDAQWRQAAETAIATFNRAGMTAVRDAWTVPRTVRCLEELQAAGQLTLRTRMLLFLDPARGVDELVAQVSEPFAGARPGGGLLRVAGVKVVLDGGVDGGHLRDDHCGDPGYRGEQLWDDDALFDVLRAAAAAGWPVGMHVVGDAALDQGLRAVERIQRERPVADLRWMFEHAFLADADQVARVRATCMGVTVQPHLAHALWPGLLERWGRDRAERVYPIRSWLDAGVPLGAGSDSPVGRYEPLSGIQWLVTRETAGEPLPDTHAMTVWEALRCYTSGSAFVSFDERDQGELVPGAVADIVVLERNPLETPAEEIGAIEVRAVLSDGRFAVDTF